MEERGHRDGPAAADLAEDVLAGNFDVAEEDLVELGLAGDLHERPDLDTRRVHVDDQICQARMPL